MTDAQDAERIASIKAAAAVYYERHGDDMEVSMSAMSPDVIYHGRADSPPTLALWKEREERFRAAMSDIKGVVRQQIAEGEMVTTYWTLTAVHSGLFMGRYEPTGKTIVMDSMCIDRVVDGKVVEHWGVRDLLSVLRQIGAVPTFTPAK